MVKTVSYVPLITSEPKSKQYGWISKRAKGKFNSD